MPDPKLPDAALALLLTDRRAWSASLPDGRTAYLVPSAGQAGKWYVAVTEPVVADGGLQFLSIGLSEPNTPYMVGAFLRVAERIDVAALDWRPCDAYAACDPHPILPPPVAGV